MFQDPSNIRRWIFKDYFVNALQTFQSGVLRIFHKNVLAFNLDFYGLFKAIYLRIYLQFLSALSPNILNIYRVR